MSWFYVLNNYEKLRVAAAATPPLKASSLAIQLFFFAHQTYGTMTSLSIPSTSSGSSISLSKLASTAFALFEHYNAAMVPDPRHSTVTRRPTTSLFPTYIQAKMETSAVFHQ